jgi:histidine triad (HIT) family protein
MNDCLFCQIIAHELPCHQVYEDDNWLAFLDINPVNLGHTLLLPKQHHRNLLDLPENLLSEVGPLIQKIALAVKEATQADGINIGWNNESSAGQIIFHSHIHIIPRFKGDGFIHWQGQGDITEEEFTKIKEAVKKALI